MTHETPDPILPATATDEAGELLPVSHFSKAQRQWVYGIASAGVPVLAITSTYVSGNADLILALIAAVLGLTGGATALSNTVSLPKA